MRIGLIGDIHLYDLRVTPRQMLSKRVLGQSNLWLNRRNRFRHALLPSYVRHLGELGLDLLLSSGDLTTSSLPAEFAKVRDALAPIADAGTPLVLVPGNHDRYTFRSQRVRRMEAELGDWVPDPFPGSRRLTDHWRLIALDSGVPNVWASRGRIGPEQLDALRAAATACEPGDGLLVLNHYPAIVPRGTARAWSHDLAEHAEVHRILESARGTVVYLHGHVHRPWHHPPETQASDGRAFGFHSLNAGSPCMVSERYPHGQGVWHLDLDGPGAVAVHHVLTDPAANTFHATEHVLSG